MSEAQQAQTPDTQPEASASEQLVALPSAPGPAELSTTTKSLQSSPEFEVDQDPRGQARAMWRESAAAGHLLTGRELGSHFNKSERWGRDRIAEVRHGDGSGNGGAVSGTATAKPMRSGNGGKPKRGSQNAVKQRASMRAESDSPEHGTPHAGVAGTKSPDDVPAQPDRSAASAIPVPAVSVRSPAGARLVAWAGFLFGTVISVAANVLHAWLPALAGETAAPGLAVQVGAAVWPIALVISVEVLSRVPWRPGWAWQLARYGGAGVVAIGAAVISYGHLHGVLAAWGYGTTGAAVGPLVVDGLMTISGFALLAMGGHGNGGKETSR